jgi:hypothetical protein
MSAIPKLDPFADFRTSLRYVTDGEGAKTAVILPIAEFEDLLDDLRDLATIAERRDEPTVSHDDLVAELKRDGLL